MLDSFVSLVHQVFAIHLHLEVHLCLAYLVIAMDILIFVILRREDVSASIIQQAKTASFVLVVITETPLQVCAYCLLTILETDLLFKFYKIVKNRNRKIEKIYL